MTTDAETERAESWIAYWQLATQSPPDKPIASAFEAPRGDPDACWRFICHVLSRIDAKPENPLFQVLAAGPLEDLLNDWGPEVIDRVEHQAARDLRFKSLLGGVWRNTIDSGVWARVEACRAQPW